MTFEELSHQQIIVGVRLSGFWVVFRPEGGLHIAVNMAGCTGWAVSIPGATAVPWLFASVGQATRSEFHFDPIEYYGARGLILLSVVGVGLVLFSLIRHRGKVPGKAAWGLLLAGTGLIPAMVLPFGTVLVFDRATKVEFCSSCHEAMQVYVDDMKAPQSESLAALHYRNRYIPDDQCYQCHSSYGMFGTVEAKLGGMMDLYKYCTGTFRHPIRMRHVYENDDCLKCHAESRKWISSHEDWKESLYRGEDSCMDCHGEFNPAHTVHPPVAGRNG